ncbi:MAG: TraG family conjugative transposon ATPase, partial [Bacteroidales bacterium]|nr:TraG family conjugative transposon ATPase [Bacteroidales bacterium]
IKIIDSRSAESKMSTNAQFMLSFSSLSPENELNHSNILSYLKDNYRHQNPTIKYSVQVQVEGEDSINNIVALMLRQGIRIRQNLYNASIAFWASIPGNSADLPYNEYMTTSMDVAVGMTALDGASMTIEGGSFFITDRITNVPVNIDFSNAALSSKLITNYNIFTLGPSGSGKSFITNELIMQAYYRDNAHCVIIDKGDSYYPLCQIIKEETSGEDGIYFNGDEYPFSFNPFIDAQSDDPNAVSFLTSLLLCIWGEKGLSQAISSKLTDAVIQFLESNCHRSLDGFYSFFFNTFLTEQWIKLRNINFKVDEFETNLSLFTRKGMYKNLLNAANNSHLTDKRFVLFEIDNISNNDRIFPLVTLLITKVFADKMKAVPGKKIMLIEEAWKAIMSPHMEGWIQWLWKTARKHNAQAIVVTQELDDLIASSVIKESIIANSDTKILLDQRTSKNNYDTIADYLSLGDQDRNIIFSINRNNNPKYRYKEAYISIGSYRYVYALETSTAAYWVYTTEPNEKQIRKEEVDRTGSYIKAITNLSKR